MKVVANAHIIRAGGSWLLGGLLLFASIAKVLHPEPFLDFVLKLGLSALGGALLYIVVVMVELIVAIGLLVFWQSLWPKWADAALLGLFSFVAGYGLATGMQASCGCYGGLLSDNGVSIWHLAANLTMAAAAVGLAKLPIQHKGTWEFVSQGDNSA